MEVINITAQDSEIILKQLIPEESSRTLGIKIDSVLEFKDSVEFIKKK